MENYFYRNYAYCRGGQTTSEALRQIMKQPRIRVKALSRPAIDDAELMRRAQCEAAGVPADAEPRV